MKIGIIGGGAWGATLAQVIVDNGHEAYIYDTNQKIIDSINNHHRHPFFDVTLPKNLRAYDSLQTVVETSEALLLAVPTRVMRDVLKNINPYLTKPLIFIDVSKGLESTTGKKMSDLVYEEINPKYLKGYAVLTGPSHAEEVIVRKITLLTVASTDEAIAKTIQEVFSNDSYLRVYTSDDVIGCELGGAAKNAIAVVSGMSTGFGMGENARAALITRGILEIARVVEFYGGKKETTFGLSGIGDLIVTASSENSRNFRAGKKLGQGISLDEIYQSEPQTIEGIRSIEALYHLSLNGGLYLPIITSAYEVIFNGMPIKEALNGMFTRSLKPEVIE